MRDPLRFLAVVTTVLAVPVYAEHEHEYEDCADPHTVLVTVREPARDVEPAFALRLLGGSTSVVNARQGTGRDGPGFGAILGAEVRLTTWLSFRSDLDVRPNGISWDAAGLKLRLPWFIAPYVAVAATLGLADGRLSLGPVGAAGLDLHLGRHFFIELEAAYRVSPSERLRRAGQLSWMAGLGYAFF